MNEAASEHSAPPATNGGAVNGGAPAPGGRREAPHAVDAERGLLGALLLNNDLFEEVEVPLQAHDFYDARHRAMYDKMLRLHGEGYVDPVLLAGRARSEGKLEDCGGNEYIADIAASGAAPVNVPAYVKLIRDTAMLRGLLGVCNEATAEAFQLDGKDPAKLMDETESRLGDIAMRFLYDRRGMREVAKMSREYFDKLTGIIERKAFHELEGIKSGYASLDKITTGFHGGDLVVIAGRPGAGKTAFALNVARHISGGGGGAVVFSLEMAAEQLIMRLLSQEGLDMQKMRDPKNMGSNDVVKFADACSHLDNREIFIEDRALINILEIKSAARRVRRSLKKNGKQLQLVVVDYLQLMEKAPGDKNDNRATEVAAISRGLKAMAKELNVPVLALSQLNRSAAGRANQEPVLSDLRESGAIEQDADLILFLHQKQDDNRDPGARADLGETIDLIVGKQRNGPVGRIKLNFQKRYSRFIEEAGGESSAF